MQSIKSYTDIEQSRKLAEILPLESADMCYRIVAYNPDDTHVYQPYCFVGTLEGDIYAWSLAALLGVLPQGYSLGNKKSNGKYYICMTCVKHDVIEYDEPIDACVNMIIRLHELKML